MYVMPFLFDDLLIIKDVILQLVTPIALSRNFASDSKKVNYIVGQQIKTYTNAGILQFLIQ